MEKSLAIRIIRDVVNRTGLDQLTHVFYERKTDGTKVTDIDPLVEHIVLEHLKLRFPEAVIVAEEEVGQSATIDELAESKYLKTVDGIDGTGEFVRHYNYGQPNEKWLVAMTAVYEKNENGLFDPVFSFAYQPHFKRLYCLDENNPVCIFDPLARAETLNLSLDSVSSESPCGSVDVYLDKRLQCPHQIDQSVVRQKGPSGFNMTALFSSANPTLSKNQTSINFTSFHYTLWDFGLWPIAKAIGFTTRECLDIEKELTSLDPKWFGPGNEVPGKISEPLFIAHPNLMLQLAGKVTKSQSSIDTVK